MCISPIRIKNPNRGFSRNKAVNGLAYLKDTTSAYINIPCGVCKECVAVRQQSVVQRLQMESRFNYMFFNTLTYSNEMLPRFTCSTGYRIRFADVSDVQNMVKRIRNDDLFGRPFRYFCVSELGTRSGRPHFHILWLVPRYDDDDCYVPIVLEKRLTDVVKSQWQRNVGSKRVPVYKPLCKFIRCVTRQGVKSTFDLHYVSSDLFHDQDSVSFYVTKYMMKPSDKAQRLQQALRLNLPEDEYDEVWKLVKPRWIASKMLGLNGERKNGKFVPDVRALDSLKNMVQSSKSSYSSPKFLSSNGSVFPLSRYFLNNGDIFSVDDAKEFYLKSDKEVNQGVSLDNTSDTHKHVTADKFQRLRNVALDNDVSYVFDELLNNGNQ